eukprot:COSAG05_NODE_8119_length_735_cov_0.650943_1_plen_143_part_01
MKPPSGAPLPLLSLLLATARVGSAAECKEQKVCTNCTEAKGALGLECVWCPAAGGSCVESYVFTKGKCTKDNIIKDTGKCPKPSTAWTPPRWQDSKMVSGCEYEMLTCKHGTKLNNSFCSDVRFLRWPASLQHKRGLHYLDNE